MSSLKIVTLLLATFISISVGGAMAATINSTRLP